MVLLSTCLLNIYNIHIQYIYIYASLSAVSFQRSEYR